MDLELQKPASGEPLMDLDLHKKATPVKAEMPSRTQTGEKKKFQGVIVDTTDVMKSKARDAGDAAMTMKAPENPDDLKGLKKFFKGEFWSRAGQKIWKHGLWRDVYRNKAAARAREKILETGNIHAGEGRNEADGDKFIKDIIEQFSSEYEEVIHKEAGEERLRNGQITNGEAVKASIKKLVVEYAKGNIGKLAFEEEEKRIFKDLKADTDGKKLQKKEDVMHASNFFYIAEQVRQARVAGEFLEAEDFDIDLIYGKSKGDVRTEAHFTGAERLAEKLSHTRLGSLANETTVAIALSLASSALTKGTQMGASFGAKVLPLVGSAAVSSAFAYIREGKKVEEERRQHEREMARGENFDPVRMERRAEMERSRPQTDSAKDLIAKLIASSANLETPELTADQLTQALVALATLEAKIRLSDRPSSVSPDGRTRDLICYSNTTEVVKERKNLDIERSKFKTKIRKLFEAGKFTSPTNGQNFESYFDSLAKTQENVFLSGDLATKDRIFEKMKSERKKSAAKRALVTGLVMGTAMQEVVALGTDQVGLAEQMFSHNVNLIHGGSAISGTGHFTALGQLGNIFNGGAPGTGILHEAIIGSHHIKLPQSVDLLQNSDGSFNLLQNGKFIADHLTINPDGTFTPDAQSILHNSGINIDTHSIAGTASTHVTTEEYIKNHTGATHEMHRDGWYDENTPMHPDPAHPGHLLGADLNELKTQLKLDANGDYIVDIGKMTPDGSFHAGMSADVKQLLADGKIKILISLSKATQHQVLEVTPTFNASGQLIIDQHSEIGKIAFANVGGHGTFTGRFLEIGQDMGNNHFNIVSTVEGHGVTDIIDTVPVATPETILDIPGSYDLPPFIPLIPRTPLETLEKKKDPVFIPTPVYQSGASIEDIQRELERRNIKNPYTINTSEDGSKITFLDKNNKEVRRDTKRERARITSYLEEQPKEYLEQLKLFNKNLEPMSENCRVVVIIPARFEEMNLANLLDQYVQQVDEKGNPISKDLFEINIIINRKEGEKADRSIEIIKEWKKKNPGYHVNVIDVAFPKEKANVGVARKYITDLSLLRSAERAKTSGPLYIESEDADLFSVDKRIINRLITGFDEKPYLDVLHGIQDRQPEIMSQNDLFFFERRLWDVGEMIMRDLSLRPDKFKGGSFAWNRVISGGWNTAYTAEAYAEIGGYVPDVIGEDMKIGQKISVLRGSGSTPNTYTAETSGLRSNSSPRRFIDAMVKQESPYDNFENQSMKGKTLLELMSGIKQFEKMTPEHKQRYESGINTLYSFMKREMGIGKEVKRVIQRTLFFMGLKEGQDYTFTKNNEIKITDKGYKKMGKLLSKYRTEEKWKLGYRRQNSPLAIEKRKIEKNKKEAKKLVKKIQEIQKNLTSATKGKPEEMSGESATLASVETKALSEGKKEKLSPEARRKLVEEIKKKLLAELENLKKQLRALKSNTPGKIQEDSLEAGDAVAVEKQPEIKTSEGPKIKGLVDTGPESERSAKPLDTRKLIESNTSDKELAQVREKFPGQDPIKVIEREVVEELNDKTSDSKTRLVKESVEKAIKAIRKRLKRISLALLVASNFAVGTSFSPLPSAESLAYDKIKVESLKDWENIVVDQEMINKLDDISVINKANESLGKVYLIVDKSVGLAHLYRSGNLVSTYEVGTGQKKGDDQTVTVVDKDGKVYWTQGNRQTGAGIYTINQKGIYEGAPSFTIVNERGIEVPTAFHKAEGSRVKLFRDNNKKNNRMSNGCLNFMAGSLEDLAKQEGFGPGVKVYILPDDPHNRFELVDGELRFTSNQENVNRTIKPYEPKPIILKAENANEDGKTLLQTLGDAENKRKIMSLYPTVSNAVYNELAKITYGIFGQESSFGTYGGLRGQAGRIGDYGKTALGIGASVGITQMKIVNVNPKIRAVFDINQTTDLYDVRKSAIATMGLLLDVYTTNIPAHLKGNYKQLVPLAYNKPSSFREIIKTGEKTRSSYVKKVLANADKVTVYSSNY